jgi:hypothetical protein
VFNYETISNRSLQWGINSVGTIVAILPFFGYWHFPDSAAQGIGERLADLLVNLESNSELSAG